METFDTDLSLMERLKSGDSSAFDTLLARHEKKIINFAYRFTGSSAEAPDIAQEVFLRVYRAAATYVPAAKFTTWLYRIAANACRDYFRKKSRDASLGATSSIDEKADDASGGPEREIADIAAVNAEQDVQQKENDQQIRQAILDLPENQRAAIIMKVYEERTYSEIAEVIGVSKASVESLIFRAKQNLKQKLKKSL